MAFSLGKLTIFVSLCGLAFCLLILMSGNFRYITVSVSEPSVDRKLSSSNTRWIAFLEKQIGVNAQMEVIQDICAEDQLQIHCLQRGTPASGGFPYVTFEASDIAAIELKSKYNKEIDVLEPDILMSIPPLEMHMEATPTNELYSWGIDRIDSRDSVLDGYYDGPTNGGSGVHVYVLDTGVKTTHEEFGGRAIPTLESLGNGLVVCDPDDYDCAADADGHGTHCAGTIGGTNFGVAKQATLHAVKVLGDDGRGYTSGIIAGVEWIARNGIRPAVISMSLGGEGRSQAYVNAIDYAVADGVTVVVAAGNSNDDACNYSPAHVPSAITVGSTEARQDARSSFSNYGKCVDIFAPGSNIVSAGVNSYAKTMSGTSMACPHVAGAAALLLQEDSSLTVAGVARVLLERASTGLVVGIGPDTVNELLYTGTAPQSPPPKIDGIWNVLDGPCRIDTETNCVSSGNFPAPYDPNEVCKIGINLDRWGSRSLYAESFDTEAGYDKLYINSIPYHGSELPSTIIPTESIYWQADSDIQGSGWLLCPSLDDSIWNVLEGPCQIDRETNCVSSGNFPAPYDPNEYCKIGINLDRWGSRSLYAKSFDTEAGYDKLYINSIPYHGSELPSTIIPTEPIIWEADGDIQRSGWLLCPR